MSHGCNICLEKVPLNGAVCFAVPSLPVPISQAHKTFEALLLVQGTPWTVPASGQMVMGQRSGEGQCCGLPTTTGQPAHHAGGCGGAHIETLPLGEVKHLACS